LRSPVLIEDARTRPGSRTAQEVKGGDFGSADSGEAKHQKGGARRQTQAHDRASAEEHADRARQEGRGHA
jgi:hypothetical protein